MEFAAWFGRIDSEGGSIALANDTAQMINSLLEDEPRPQDSQPDLRSIAKACGFAKGDADYNEALREVAIGLVHQLMKSQVTAEQEVLQMIEALDDLDQAANLLEERLYEWSLLYRDEMARGRDLPAALAGPRPIGELSRAVLQLREARQQIEQSLGTSISAIAPNLSSLAGPLLAARLISRAGSLKRLSEVPASAIQLIGAEKSLFKHLRGKSPPPKHGIIYRHPAIMNAPKRLRGRSSRALACKLAIAARIDCHRGRLYPELKTSLEKRLSSIRSAKKAEHSHPGQGKGSDLY